MPNVSIPIKIKHLQQQQSFPCEICGYKAKQKVHLHNHVENVHGTNEKIACTDCNKKVKQWSMPEHKRSFYSKENTKYSCDMCTFTTFYKGNLSTHKKAHKK